MVVLGGEGCFLCAKYLCRDVIVFRTVPSGCNPSITDAIRVADTRGTHFSVFRGTQLMCRTVLHGCDSTSITLEMHVCSFSGMRLECRTHVGVIWRFTVVGAGRGSEV